MKPRISHLVSLLFLLSEGSWGITQNLVPNPSFETLSPLPSSYGQLPYATGWQNAYGTPDIFHVSASTTTVGIPANYFGNQAARTGSAYAGLASSQTGSYHEYMRIQLSAPLVVGNSYYCEAYVSAGEGPYRYGMGNFGFLLSNSAISGSAGDPPISLTPQVNWASPIMDYSNWVLISGTFTATTPAQWLTLGNFYSIPSTTWSLLGTSGSINSQYWFIEDVVVQPNTALDLAPVHLEANLLSPDRVSLNWEWKPDPSDVQFYIEREESGHVGFHQVGSISIDPGEEQFTWIDQPGRYWDWVSYRIKKTAKDGSVSFSEAVRVDILPSTVKESLLVYPMPVKSGGDFNIVFAGNPDQSAKVEILNNSGQIVYSECVYSGSKTFRKSISMGNLTPGIYLLRIIHAEEIVFKRLPVLGS